MLKNSFSFMGRTGFDSAKYLDVQSDAIIERASHFHKLYLEFGGKLLFDYHAARVLPGYCLNSKMEVIKRLAQKRHLEFLFCVSARDLQNGKRMGALGITYRDFSLKMLDSIKGYGFAVPNVVINLFSGEPAAKQFGGFLKKQGYRVYYRGLINNYPDDLKTIASSRGFGKKPFIKTQKSIVIVTGAGPNSGKMATCLAMVYQDYIKEVDSGYAKFESFPIWDLQLANPINLAYEAATADIDDYNLIDPYHLKAYGIKAVNYNRDVKSFVMIQSMFNRIISEKNFMRTYKSPTDMGLNRMTSGIRNLKLCEHAARQEIIRRYFAYLSDFLSGTGKEEPVFSVKELMRRHKISFSERPVVEAARKTAEKAHGNQGLKVGCAIMLPDGAVITGKNSPLMHAESAAIVNALKKLAKIDDTHILPLEYIHQIKELKKKMHEEDSENLDVHEILVVLAISAKNDGEAGKAFDCLGDLHSCELHTTHMLSRKDTSALRALGINFTSDGKMEVGKLYMG
ncbi:MAG: DUF1846 domain-containing protein [Candidatus Micrarchaeia archaeon]